jgi:predicted Zn-ribbon and HTH transcriptional regulator
MVDKEHRIIKYLERYNTNEVVYLNEIFNHFNAESDSDRLDEIKRIIVKLDNKGTILIKKVYRGYNDLNDETKIVKI